MDAYIEFRNVVKKFDDFVALDHVSLQIPKGAFVTLLGPSGCGKTTLMRQLAGFSEPEEGDILVDGKRMNGLPPFKRNTPLVFQEYALFPHMTVYENISYGLKLKKTPKEEKDRKVAEMLEMFNLQGLEGRFPKQLSGGQQQRVAFARALVMGQEILLLDEPLSNLDAKLRVEVRTELRQIQQKFGITTMYVTHDQDEALSMSDIIAVMRRGRIEQIGSPWEIYFRPANRFVADFVGTVNFLEGTARREADGSMSVDETEDVFCVWRGRYDAEAGALRYGMDIFEREGESWLRSGEEHVEYAHEPETLKAWLAEEGFTDISAAENGPIEGGGRVYFKAKRGND